jgi:hypothetical protein
MGPSLPSARKRETLELSGPQSAGGGAVDPADKSPSQSRRRRATDETSDCIARRATRANRASRRLSA